MGKFYEVSKMDSFTLVNEFKRLVELEMKGLTDNSISYSFNDLEEEILYKLRELEGK